MPEYFPENILLNILVLQQTYYIYGTIYVRATSNYTSYVSRSNKLHLEGMAVLNQK